MNESSSSRHTRLLVVLVAFLVVVAMVQGYYLFRVHQQKNSNMAYAAEEGASGLNGSVKDKDWHVATPNGSGNGFIRIPDPFSTSPSKPFDPNTWNPFKEMEAMQKQMDQMFEQAFGHFSASPQFNGLSQGFSFNPKSDIEENDREYIVRLDIPGADSSKIKATIDDRILTISGSREEEVSQQGVNKQVHHERRLGQFERMLTLPGPVKQDGLKASYKDGVLTITIPKDVAPAQGKAIPIQ